MGCTCQIEVDIDPYDCAIVSSSEIRTARKEHRCYECNKPISPGESYENSNNLYDGKWATYKTCIPCKEIRDCYCCTWYYGNVWESLYDHFRWEEWNLCVLDKLPIVARPAMIAFLDDILDDLDDE